MTAYTSFEIMEKINEQQKDLFDTYKAGRGPNWSCDNRTRLIVCVDAWLTSELKSLDLSQTDRIIMQSEFNRCSRTEEDLYELATRIMNDAVKGNFNRNRKPHKRWGL